MKHRYSFVVYLLSFTIIIMHRFIWLKGSETGQGNPQMDIQWSMPPRGQIVPPPHPGMGYWPPPPWGYPTHPMGPWGRPPWPT
jgi:hypothetical protein